jgi:hypothetical protein
MTGSKTLMKYEDYKDRIATLIEIQGLYDGWSVALLTDGTMVNRWEEYLGGTDDGYYNDAYYRRKYQATQEWILQNPL